MAHRIVSADRAPALDPSAGTPPHPNELEPPKEERELHTPAAPALSHRAISAVTFPRPGGSGSTSRSIATLVVTGAYLGETGPAGTSSLAPLRSSLTIDHGAANSIPRPSHRVFAAFGEELHAHAGTAVSCARALASKEERELRRWPSPLHFIERARGERSYGGPDPDP
jgi:hypothetical protein